MRKRNVPTWPKVGMILQAMFSRRKYRVTEVIPGTKEGDRGKVKCIRVETDEPAVIENNPHIYSEV